MHQLSENIRALFQVASQFNLLEMVSPTVTPEQGVTCYQNDHTQGARCLGAATIYRNYFAPIGSSRGQTRGRQIDALADLGVALSSASQRGDCRTAVGADRLPLAPIGAAAVTL
jgi:hypothetical protein